MRIFLDMGPIGGVILMVIGIVSFAVCVALWRAAPATVKKYEEDPEHAPEGWLGDRLPSIASLRFPAICGFVGGVLAFGFGVLQVLGLL